MGVHCMSNGKFQSYYKKVADGWHRAVLEAMIDAAMVENRLARDEETWTGMAVPC